MPATSVSVRSYTVAITHVTNKIIKSFKDVLMYSGLDPTKLANQTAVLERGFQAWIESGHLEKITLEIYDEQTDAALGFWDVEVTYGYSDGAGEFWTDTEAIKYAIRKAGVHPSNAAYRIVVTNKTGARTVDGWSSTTARSRSGFVQQSLGTTIDASRLSAGMSYYRRV